MSGRLTRSSARLLLLSLMSAGLGCSTVGAGTSDYCTLYKPILVSKQDVLTDGTVDQILRANETWERVCK